MCEDTDVSTPGRRLVCTAEVAAVLGLDGASPPAGHKAVQLLLSIVFTDFQKENIPIVQATGKGRRASVSESYTQKHPGSGYKTLGK